MKSLSCFLFLLLPIAVFSVSCSNQVKARQPVSYRFDNGRTAMIKNGLAYAPRSAPPAVKRAIAAGNRLQGKPYKWGGGHANHHDSGYDCSGTTSYVLREAGLMKGSKTSSGFMEFGKKGYGKWITLYVRNGHVFMTIAGLRLDTGGRNESRGPRWQTSTRQGSGHVVRHPAGF